MNFGEKSVAVVCHDAGATNLLLGWLKRWNLSVVPFMQGPAVQLWKNTFPDISLCDSLGAAINSADVLISGTGWSSRIEYDARSIARSVGMRSVAVLDHWVNYRDRFERDGSIVWPDELWVADEWALQIARKEVPEVPVRVFRNHYLQDQVAKIPLPPQTGTLLYTLEPVRHSWGRGRPGEFQALEYTLNKIDRLYPAGVSKILLRPHPSESPVKYEKYLLSDTRVQMDASEDLASAISLADVVVGVETFALTVALEAERIVYSSLPPWGPPLRLPHSGIRQIRDLKFL